MTALITMKANDLAELVKQKIDNLGPKLLDLSRRNPLVSIKLSPRSEVDHDAVRVDVAHATALVHLAGGITNCVLAGH